MGCLTAASALPGRRPHGGEQAQHHEPLPGTGACCGEVRVCAALQAHPGARLRQPPAGPVLPAAAAEQAGGEWPSGEAAWVGQATPGAAPSALHSPCPVGTCLRVTREAGIWRGGASPASQLLVAAPGLCRLAAWALGGLYRSRRFPVWLEAVKVGFLSQGRSCRGSGCR